MSFRDGIENRLKSKGTEEVRPGFFIQPVKDFEGKVKRYKKVTPLVWKGKWTLKKQFSWKNLIWPIILLIILYGYFNAIDGYIQFYDVVHENPIGFCEELYQSMQPGECTDFFRENGLCLESYGIDLTNIEVINETGTKNIS